MIAALGDRTVAAVCRQGKQLWLEMIDKGPSLLLHFGMTGAVVIEGKGSMEYKSFKVCGLMKPLGS
jgi:formamidopyrimidine-DNA glycosylase